MLEFCMNSKAIWLLVALHIFLMGALVGYLRYQTRCIQEAEVELEKLCARRKLDWGKISKSWKVCEGDIESLHMS